MIARLSTSLLLSIALAGCRSGAPGPQASDTQTAGPFTIQFRSEPDPPHVGLDTRFIVSVRDASGAVSGASISLQLACTSFHQQGPQALATETAGWPGRYESEPVTTGAAGNWSAEVTVRDPRRGEAKATFPFAVRQ